MMMCQEHWDRLRRAIDERGLSHLIARDSKRALEALTKEAEGTAGPNDYDPFMAANWAIMSQALKCGGLYLMEDGPDGPYCPLCEAAKHGGEGTDREWIIGSCDYQLEYARSIGLAAKRVPDETVN